jgi:CubicO group peptidase (beta-lactamase class C family)
MADDGGAERFSHVRRLLAETVAARELPGIAAGVSVAGHHVLREAFGWAQWVPTEEPLTLAHRFDLASLTKVMATTPLILLLAQDGVIRLDDPLTHFGPDFAFPDLRLMHLLTHQSGLPAWLDLSASAGPADRLRIIRDAAREFRPGTRTLYSDCNYVVLGHLVERLYAAPLHRVFAREVAEPLGLPAAAFGPVPPETAAATELDAATGLPFRGVVHDENARAAGGVLGHAGLFGTVEDLLVFGDVLVRAGRTAGGRLWMAPAVVEAWLRPRPPAEPGQEVRTIGFQVPHPLASAGDFLSPRAVGHTGFTGTSLWIDPEREVVLALLTNRVHPSRANDRHIRLRPRFHNAVMGDLGRQPAPAVTARRAGDGAPGSRPSGG